jgi:RNA-directed DNA polymerase
MPSEHEKPTAAGGVGSHQAPGSGPPWVAEGPVVPRIAGRSKAGGREGALVLGAYEEEESQGIGRDALPTPKTVRNLQKKLYLKAKQEAEFRFYSLYDKIYREDILAHAWALVKANRGAAGVDGVETFDVLGQETEFLAKLKEELRTQTYKPLPVRRVNIPKPDGGLRPLGIPCVRDRIAQQAARLVLEPIFEADFPDAMYGYRPQRQAHQALRRVQGLLKAGYTEVVDADLSKYFDTIPHQELMRSVARRISDGKVLKLIKLWLKAPVQERDEDGTTRLSGGQHQDRGTPQGGVISPLLANIYMRRFLMAWAEWKLPEKLQAHVVNYADDFVILCRGTARAAREVAGKIVGAMKLAVNEEKTRIVDAWQETFDFLGYTFGRCWSPRTGQVYLGARPAKKRLKRFYASIRDFLGPGNQWSIPDVLLRLNLRVSGWANYYSYGTLSKAYRWLDFQLANRFRAWLCRRGKIAGLGTRRYPDRELYAMGLICLSEGLAIRRRANASGETSPRAGCGKTARPVR